MIQQNQGKSANTPENLKYTKEHEWIRARRKYNVGISPILPRRIRELVYVEAETDR